MAAILNSTGLFTFFTAAILDFIFKYVLLCHKSANKQKSTPFQKCMLTPVTRGRGLQWPSVYRICSDMPKKDSIQKIRHQVPYRKFAIRWRHTQMSTAVRHAFDISRGARCPYTFCSIYLSFQYDTPYSPPLINIK